MSITTVKSLALARGDERLYLSSIHHIKLNAVDNWPQTLNLEKRLRTCS